MRWWGWGRDEDAIELPPAAAGLLHGELGLRGDERGARVELSAVAVPPSRLGDDARGSLIAAVGADAVADGHEVRVAHAAGRSYPDLVRLRAGDASGAPDAVVFPSSSAQLAPLLAACAQHGVAVIPFGGGTSVVGGVEALPGDHHAAVTLDLSRLNAVVDVDTTSLTATVEAGIFGPSSSASSATPASRSATSRSRSSTRPSAAGSPPAPPARPRPATGGSTSSSRPSAASRPPAS